MEVNKKGRAKSGGLKRQFSQVERDLDLQKIPKLVPIPKKKTPRKKVVVVKDKDEKGNKVGKNWVDGEVLHLITLKGEMEFEFAKNAKNKVNFVFVLEVFFQL
jgi:hypothetical protein